MKRLLVIVFCLMLFGCGGGGGSEAGNNDIGVSCIVSSWVAAGQSNMRDFDGTGVPTLFKQYLSEFLDFDIDVFKTAEKGTMIECWDGGRCFAEHIAPLSEEDIVGVIWWQGESDSRYYTPADEYYRRLSNIIIDWRSMWGDDLIFIIVELHSYLDQNDNWNKIRTAQHRVANDMDNVYIVRSADLTDYRLHPSGSYDEISYRLAEVARESVCSGDE